MGCRSKYATTKRTLELHSLHFLGSSPYAQADSNLKSILVTGNRETRQKKSLTIVNHRAAQLENNSVHDVEVLWWFFTVYIVISISSSLNFLNFLLLCLYVHK